MHRRLSLNKKFSVKGLFSAVDKIILQFINRLVFDRENYFVLPGPVSGKDALQ